MAVSVSEAIPLAEVPNFLPRRRRGRRVHVATLYRWSTVGCRGIVLETIQIGATRCTSKQALDRFFEKLTKQSAGKPVPEPLPRARAADVRRAERVLDKAGI
jgi:hypothetical protein